MIFSEKALMILRVPGEFGGRQDLMLSSEYIYAG
jgi:hypothetical protein